MKNKLLIALASLALITLAACGGGGSASPTNGGEVTPPVVVNTPTMTVTYTATSMCASGPNLTSTVSQAVANALVPGNCPALLASAYASTSVVVGSGTLTLSVNNLPAGFTGGVLMVSRNVPSAQSIWDIIPSTTGNGTAKFRDGSATPLYASVYQGVLEMNFVGAPSASKTITFTTGADPVANLLDQAKAAIVPQGQQRNVPATELPASVTKVTDAGFLAGVVNGTVMLIDTGMKMTGNPTVADRTRDLVASIYRQNGNYYIKMLFKNTLTAATTDDRLILALSGASFDRAQGTSDGLLNRNFNSSIGQNQCSLVYWVDPTSGFSAGFGSKASTACPIWN